MAETCEAAGIAAPTFQEIGGSAVVTFRVSVAWAESRPESRPESGGLEDRILMALDPSPLSKSELAHAVGQKGVSGQLKKSVSSLLVRGVIEFAVLEKPGSRLQRYRLTTAGRAALAKARGR